jgi:PAS domain S-box-containing protein
MPDQTLHVLLIEDSPTDVLLVQEALAEAAAPFVVTVVERLSEGLGRLAEAHFDAVLLDLGLPDSQGLETFVKVHSQAPGVSCLVLTNLADDTLAMQAVRAGAQDYLVKAQMRGELLSPTIRHAVERKRAEAALSASRAMFQQLFESAPDANVIVDREGRIVRLNAQAETLFGYRREELHGQPIEILIPERFSQKHTEHRAGYVASPRMRGMGAGLELYGRRKDGREVPVDITLGPLQTNGEALVLSVIRNIAERKEAEAALAAKNEALRAMTQQLWQTARLATMGELAASIAHELNNPLGTVTLRLEALLNEIPADDPHHRALEIVEQECERMGQLVGNLLQFSRRGPQQISTLDVRDEIAKTLELIHYQLRQRQIVVALEFAPDAPLVQADRQQLRQLFLNLFANASDAMLEGGTLTLRVGVWEYGSGDETSARPHSHTPPHIFIEVADTGVGIAPEDLPKVVEPFYTTKPEGKGTGLGLAICRRIAQEHGGTLDLTSAGPGRGATARVTLPIQNKTNGQALTTA